MVNPKLVLAGIAGEPVCAALAVEVGVVGKHPVRIQGLLGVLDEQAPVFTGFIGKAEPSAIIGGIVKVVFNQRAVIGGLKWAVRMDGSTRPVVSVEHVNTGGKATVVRIIENIIDPAGLMVVVRGNSHRQTIRQRLR